LRPPSLLGARNRKKTSLRTSLFPHPLTIIALTRLDSVAYAPPEFSMQLLFFVFFSLSCWSKPYFHPDKVILPRILNNNQQQFLSNHSFLEKGTDVLRVEVNWRDNETYSLGGMYLEKTGTTALINKSLQKDHLGSYKAELLLHTLDGEKVLHSSIGTGKEFRRLTRTLSFRFPFLSNIQSARLVIYAEHPEFGVSTKVLEQDLSLIHIRSIEKQDVTITLLQKAARKPVIKFNFYAEGFEKNNQEKFLQAARKAIGVLNQHIPGAEHFEYHAIFATSKMKLGSPKDLGPAVKVHESFLGLYFPYWRKFGRWYHVVYPTSETRYRNALAQAPYDYPLVLIDDSGYWGVGNYKELTAIPINSPQFSYLLLHEFGHFMGLNEEYEGGGPTELEFAPKIKEPWSQNITFNPKDPKWKDLIEPGISLPTTQADYQRYGGLLKNPVGAYRGGYADSGPVGRSHKPVRTCMMSSGGDFCKVCQKALLDLIHSDAGIE
jgi:hypothetical protein